MPTSFRPPSFRTVSRAIVGLIAAGVIVLPTSVSAQDDKKSDRPPSDRVRDQDRPTDRRTDQPVRRPQQQHRPFAPPPDIEMVRDVVFATVPNDDGSTHELMMNVFFPKESGENALPAIVYIHGGGWSEGARSGGNQTSALMARGGYLTATIDYRLVQDAKFPAALHDCKAAIRFLRANAEELGLDPERIGVWGHSAGGHLAAFLGTSGNDADSNGEVGDFDDTAGNVACVVDFFGPADLQTLFARRTRGRYRERLFGEVDDEQFAALARYASPASWIDADDPPVLIIHGTADKTVPIAQSEAFHQALQDAGVESEFVAVDGAGHGFSDPTYLVKTAEFFDQQLGGESKPTLERLVERIRAEQARRRQLEQRRRDAEKARRQKEGDTGDGGDSKDHDDGP